MSKKTSALISAAITLLIFTGIPLLAPRYLPPAYIENLANYGIEFGSFTNQLAILGCVVAVLTLIKGFVAPSSPLYLLAALASNGVTFAFTILTLSLGKLEDFGNLGLTSMEVEAAGSMNLIVLDFRFLVQLTAVTVGLKMVEAIFAFIEARKEEKGETSSTAPPAEQTPDLK